MVSDLQFQLALSSLPTLQLFAAPPPEVAGLVQEILEEFYTDGIDQVVSVQLEGDAITGEFIDRVGTRQVKRYKYRITNAEIAFKLLNPSEVENFVFESFKPKFGKGSRAGGKKTCTKGTPCGDTCIQADKTCRKKPGSATKAKIAEVKEKLGTVLPLNSPDLPENHVLGSDDRITTAKIDRALRYLEDDDNRENMAKFRQFVAQSGVRSLWHSDILQSEIDYAKFATELDARVNFVLPPPGGSKGYTHAEINHVVIKTKDDAYFDEDDAKEVKSAVLRSIKDMSTARELEALGVLDEDDAAFPWSISAMAGSRSESGGVLATYLHEMGHKIHHKDFNKSVLDEVADPKSMTVYGEAEDTEWAAEHFVAWVAAPKEYKAYDPVGYKWINDMVGRALD